MTTLGCSLLAPTFWIVARACTPPPAFAETASAPTLALQSVASSAQSASAGDGAEIHLRQEEQVPPATVMV
jgi:hypothetical protein